MDGSSGTAKSAPFPWLSPRRAVALANPALTQPQPSRKLSVCGGCEDLIRSARIHFESEIDSFMANHVSALKRTRQTATRTAVNRSNRTTFRSSLRALREAIQKGDAKAAGEQYRATVSALDKSVQKGVLHKNTASRYKSRLNARVKAVGAKKSA
jgi:small subunit ribosomal protein S20